MQQVGPSIHVRSDNGAVVVALAGTADAPMLDSLRDPLSAALADIRALVLDLDEVTTLDAAALRDVLVRVLDTAGGGQLCLAASREATIARLAEARIHHLVAVHHSVADALPAGDDHDEVIS